MSRQLTARDYAAKTVHNPCQGCTDRHHACWGSCESYKNYLDEFRETSDRIYQEQKRQNLADDFAYAGRLKGKQMREAARKRGFK